MTRRQWVSPLAMAVIAVIGCGGSTPQDADSAPAKSVESKPIQLTQAISAAAPVAVSGAAGVTGVAKFSGDAPKRKKIKMNADPVCQQQHAEAVYEESVVVNDNGTLRNVFVYVKEGVSGEHTAPASPVTLDQVGCQYSPHVAGIQVGQALQIINSDATLHNVNAKPSINRPFNIAQPVKDMKTEKKFTKPEIMVRFKCNVHPWMNAYLGVVDHPYFAVTGENGSFAVPGLPDGSYVLEAWHETYGTQTQSVTVAGGKAASIEFSFSAQHKRYHSCRLWSPAPRSCWSVPVPRRA